MRADAAMQGLMTLKDNPTIYHYQFTQDVQTNLAAQRHSFKPTFHAMPQQDCQKFQN
jgi:hypothetical protein